jgi:hypothetical protein
VESVINRQDQAEERIPGIEDKIEEIHSDSYKETKMDKHDHNFQEEAEI